MPTIALDLDGTLIERKWPEMGEWFPGAIDAAKELLAMGHHCYIYSARLSSRHPSGDVKDPAMLYLQRQAVRDLLDAAGLEAVTISEADKPFWHVLVDDRALRFPGRSGSWRHMVPKIHARVTA